MAQAPPILIYEPGGGVSSPIGSNPPVYSQAGTTVLVEDQGYVDVVFGSTQTNDEWVLVQCVVVNETDVDPLNLWSGIITDKTGAGFRIYLNGLPDSGNYYLHWSVSGINIEPSVATTYYLSGPSSGEVDEVITFTVSLPPSTYVNSPVIVTPAEGGLEIGIFSPETVTLTTDSPSKTFTFTPSITGDTTITVNNDRGLTDPADLVLSVVPAEATTYTLSGPSSGDIGVASTNFTVALPVDTTVTGTVTVTPSDGGGGGTFTPTTATLTTAVPSDTFTYTPASGGTKTISVTNDGDLTNPDNLSYLSVAPFSPLDITGCKVWLKADSLALADNTTVTAWNDSSATGYNLTGVGSPKLRTNIVNGKPVVRFYTGTFDHMIGPATTGVTQPNTWFFVANETNKPAQCVIHWQVGGQLLYLDTSGFVSVYAGSSVTDNVDSSGAFHCFSVIFSGGNVTIYRDGSLRLGPTACGSNGVTTIQMMWDGATPYEGDVAELILYDSALGTSDRQDVEAYLADKYGL